MVKIVNFVFYVFCHNLKLSNREILARFFCRHRIIIKFVWKGKGTRIAKTCFEKELSGKNQLIHFQGLLKSYNSKDGMVLAEK